MCLDVSLGLSSYFEMYLFFKFSLFLRMLLSDNSSLLIFDFTIFVILFLIVHFDSKCLLAKPRNFKPKIFNQTTSEGGFLADGWSTLAMQWCLALSFLVSLFLCLCPPSPCLAHVAAARAAWGGALEKRKQLISFSLGQLCCFAAPYLCPLFSHSTHLCSFPCSFFMLLLHPVSPLNDSD